MMSKRKERKREKGLDAEILTMKTRKCFEREKVMVMRWNPSESPLFKDNFGLQNGFNYIENLFCK